MINILQEYYQVMVDKVTELIVILEDIIKKHTDKQRASLYFKDQQRLS